MPGSETRPASSSSASQLEKEYLETIKTCPSPPAPDFMRYGDGGCAAFPASAYRLGKNVLAVAALKISIVKTDICLIGGR